MDSDKYLQQKSKIGFPTLLLLVAIASGGMAMGWPGKATADEVDCASIRLQVSEPGYDTSCETNGGVQVTTDVLEANAADGTHFMVIFDLRTNHRYIFPGKSSLREDLNDLFSDSSIDDWRSGRAQQGLKTAEFSSEFKSIPSDCVGFQHFSGKQIGGWRRYIFGFGCSRTGDREQVYAALRYVNFPD